jgi:hypothetical protein
MVCRMRSSLHCSSRAEALANAPSLRTFKTCAYCWVYPTVKALDLRRAGPQEAELLVSGEAELTKEFGRARRLLERALEHKITGTDPRMVDQCLKYAVGTPRKQQPVETGKRSLVFIAEGGLPWENDPMKDQEARPIAAQQAQDKIEAAAAERKRQGREPDPDDDDDPDAPQLVR